MESLHLEGDLSVPTAAHGVVLFAHGSGSSRRSPRNRYVADLLNESGLATLLMDLLTEDEQQVDLQTAHLRFDIPLLAKRLEAITQWLAERPEVARFENRPFRREHGRWSGAGGGSQTSASGTRSGLARRAAGSRWTSSGGGETHPRC